MKQLFYPYLLADYPSSSRFQELFQLTLRHADLIEVGVPFTDPVADGPIIQKASASVLDRGFQLDSLLKFLQSQKSSVPIALMSYANPILAYGRTNLIKACRNCGVRSLIVPDVPFEESADWKEEAAKEGISWISFLSLQTRPDRLQQIASSAEGFVYLLSLTGITGSTITRPEAVQKKAKEIKKFTQVPVALGFGIKSQHDVLPYLKSIDAFIVGSRIIELITRQGGLKEVETFYREFRNALEIKTGESK
jgi:tryptophan synthase alpha subunit